MDFASGRFVLRQHRAEVHFEIEQALGKPTKTRTRALPLIQRNFQFLGCRPGFLDRSFSFCPQLPWEF